MAGEVEDCVHKHNHECVDYLRAQGYTDVRDDQCCYCYFNDYSVEELDKNDKTNDDQT